MRPCTATAAAPASCHAPGELRRVDLAVVPPGAHLHGHRDLHGLRHRGDDRLRVLGLAHQAAAGVVLRDFRHRAAHVDVDDVGAHAFDDLRGIGHLLRIAAEDLDRDGTLFLGVLGVLERAIDPAHESLGAHHLGDDQAAPAAALHQAAEGGIRHARHGGERERLRELDVPIFMISASLASYVSMLTQHATT